MSAGTWWNGLSGGVKKAIVIVPCVLLSAAIAIGTVFALVKTGDNATIGTLTTTVTEQENTIGEQDSQIQDQQNTIDDQQSTIEDQQQQIEDYEAKTIAANFANVDGDNYIGTAENVSAANTVMSTTNYTLKSYDDYILSEGVDNNTVMLIYDAQSIYGIDAKVGIEVSISSDSTNLTSNLLLNAIDTQAKSTTSADDFVSVFIDVDTYAKYASSDSSADAAAMSSGIVDAIATSAGSESTDIDAYISVKSGRADSKGNYTIDISYLTKDSSSEDGAYTYIEVNSKPEVTSSDDEAVVALSTLYKQTTGNEYAAVPASPVSEDEA